MANKHLWPLIFLGLVLCTSVAFVIGSSLKEPGVPPEERAFITEDTRDPESPRSMTPDSDHVSGNSSPADHDAYLAIQDLMSATPLANPEVLEESLRSYDIDGDGDLDVVGFFKLTFSSKDFTHLFGTWHWSGTRFIYYEPRYSDFRSSPPCEITDLSLQRVTLDCGSAERAYPIVLRYQPNGEGYYNDVSGNATTFDGNASWQTYESDYGGINFKHAPDVTVTERTYFIYDDLITVITGTRGGKTLFEIDSVPYSGPDTGGGLIDNAWQWVYLRLPDGSYLSRDIALSPSVSGVAYQRIEANKKGGVGFFNSYDASNVAEGRRYTLYTPLATEAERKEIDNIFASITYVNALATHAIEAQTVTNSPLILNDTVTLAIPGYLSNADGFTDNTDAVVAKGYDVTFLDSITYTPAYISLHLYPFGSQGTKGIGGYDAEENSCYKPEEGTVPLKKIGENDVCAFGWGDGGEFIRGYYVLDPHKKYILQIAESPGNGNGIYGSLISPDMDDIAKTVHFATGN